MKITFKAVTDFWHDRVLIPAGSVVDLTKNEAKYLMHAVVPHKDEPKPAKKEDVKTDAKA